MQVTPQSVQERINLTESAVSDDIVNRFIIDSAGNPELETSLTIDPDSCTDAEAVAIRNLAAVYRGAYITRASWDEKIHAKYTKRMHWNRMKEEQKEKTEKQAQ